MANAECLPPAHLPTFELPHLQTFKLPPLLLLVLAAALTTVSVARANVTLVSFTAAPGDGEVDINWETATEIDTAGFFVRRSEAENGEFARISDFIPAEGDGLTGATYEYLDEGLTNGMTYFYQLEAIDYDQSVEFFGPISVTLSGGGATPTLTPTDTSTPQGNPTATSTSRKTKTPTHTPTRTPTRTRVPTKTPTPRPHYTPTPTFTASPIPSPTSTPTREFFSPPSPTLPGASAGGAYPALAESPTTVFTDTTRQTSAPRPAPSQTFAPAGKSASKWASTRGLALGLVALLWLLLAAWMAYFVFKVGDK